MQEYKSIEVMNTFERQIRRASKLSRGVRISMSKDSGTMRKSRPKLCDNRV
jgi:hypothetical protein